MSNQDANPVIKQLELFDPPPLLNSIEKKTWIEYKPIAPITDQRSPVEFHVPGSPQQYIDLKHSFLQLKVEFMKEDGSKVTETDKVVPANAFLHSLWDQVDIQLENFNPCASVSRHYGYKALFDIIMNEYSEVGEQTNLRLECFVREAVVDKPYQGTMTLVTSKLVRDGALLELQGPIRSDLCQIDKFLPNSVPLRVKMYPSLDSFRLVSEGDEKFKAVIRHASLKICQLKLTPEQTIKVNDEFQKRPAMYCYDRSDFKTYQLSQGSYAANIENPFSGMVPKSILLAMVSSESYAGSYNKNPFYFHHNFLNFAECALEGISIPAVPLRPDFENNQFAEAFSRLLKDDSQALGIRYFQYPKGNALFYFNLVSEEEQGMKCQPKSGNMRITLNFAKALPTGMTLIIYARFPDTFYIDQLRSVYAG